MNFLYPQFLFGLLAVAIPIVIHLFNLQRPKKVLFPNVRFLKQVQQTTSKRLKLKHLLVLLARIAFIICLVLMFAQPMLFLDEPVNRKGKTAVSLYLDNSLSMQNELGEEKGLDIGVKSIQELVSVFPAATSYSLLTNDFEGRDQYFKNKDKLQERITEVNFSATSRTGNEILARQHQSLNTQGFDSKHIVWFTDFQQKTIGKLAQLSFDSTVTYHFLPIQNSEVANVSVDSLWLSSPLLKEGENNTVEAIIHNSGMKEVRELTIKLYIEEVQVSTSVVTIAPKSSSNVSFIINVNGQGQKKAVLRFEDYPVVFDNEYYFTLQVSPKIKILHLYEKDPESILKVYDNESIFEATSNRSGDIDYSKISESSLIVLNGVNTISSALWKPLKDFVSNGGSLVVYPEKDFDEKSYASMLSQFGYRLPEKIKADTSMRSTSELAVPDFSNPFFSNVFEKKEEKMAMPYAIPVINWGAEGEVLLRYKNNEPFFQVRTFQKGKVYLANSPLLDELSGLPRHSLFVPLMYKIAFNSIISSEKLAYTFQEKTISVSLEKEKGDPSLLYTLESNDMNNIPSQWYSGGKLIIELPSAKMKAGFYELKSEGNTQKVIAVNYDKKESDMEFCAHEDLTEITKKNKNVKLYNADSGSQFAALFVKNNVGVALWKYFLIGALFFLMAEILLLKIKS